MAAAHLGDGLEVPTTWPYAPKKLLTWQSRGPNVMF